MLLVHDIEKFVAPWEFSVLTLGVFDGLHKGHQALLSRIFNPKYGKNNARILVTYHPHPDFILGKRKKAIEIFTFHEKISLLQAHKLDAVIFLKFTPKLAKVSAGDYLHNFLIKKLKAKHIIIGYDQCFGHERKGNYAFLKKMAQDYKYEVERIRPLNFLGTKISSSRIRRFIQTGKIAYANSALGHCFFMSGIVVKGFQRGLEMGFPTLNLETSKTKIRVKNGVYLGYINWGGKRYKAMINIGFNPTFHNNAISIEAHVLDFSENLYGQNVSIYFLKRIRNEIQFSTREALVKRLFKDKKIVDNFTLK